MADILHGLALYLDEQGLALYDPTGAGGDLFIETMPDVPGEAVALYQYDGGEQHAAIAYDAVRVQVRVRGTADPRVSRGRARVLYGALQGLSDMTLPDGTHLIICSASSSIAGLGVDKTGRHEHVCNYETEYAQTTTHRA